MGVSPLDLILFLGMAFSKKKTLCAFCPESANLTGEHLFADWIDKILTKATTHYTFHEIDSATLEYRKWSRRHLDRKAKVVCGDCNNTWMSDIDNAARNTLKDVIRYRAPVSFLPSGVESIAAFAMKNALVADYTYTSPFFTSNQRGQFKKSRKFPPGTYIWFGAVAPDRVSRHGICSTLYGKPNVDASNSIETYVFTWAAESLLLQLVAARWTNILTLSRSGPPELWQDAPLNDVFVPFWPAAPSHVAWPPARYVSHKDLHAIAERFKFIRFV